MVELPGANAARRGRFPETGPRNAWDRKQACRSGKRPDHSAHECGKDCQQCQQLQRDVEVEDDGLL